MLTLLMIQNPHDALFKRVLGQPEHGPGVLRAIVPPVLAEALDWQTLAFRPGSFVDEAFTYQHTDLLYAVRWRDGGEALIYLLFEHQSTPPTEGLMVHQLLGYQDRIWRHWRADHPSARTLPMILPIVMYHGPKPWSEPLSFEALLEVPPGVRSTVEPYLVRCTYVLYDLSEISDDELREGAMGTALAKLVTMCFKHAGTRADFLKALGRWMEVVREVARTPDGVVALALLEREIGPEIKDIIVTAGQQLIKLGIEQGRKQGIQALLLRQLRKRFGAAVDPRVEQRIATASVAQIETWSERLLTAAKLTEVLAD